MSKGIKKILRVMSAVIACGVVTVTLSSKAYAKVDSLVVKDLKTNESFEYNYDELLDSAVKSISNQNGKELYEDFEKNQEKNGISALHDDVRNGYVRFDSVINSAIKAITDKKTFDIDAFTEMSSEAEEVRIGSIIEKKIKDGQLVEEKKNSKFEVIDIK